MMAADNEEAAQTAADWYGDPRLHQTWDPNRKIGELIQRTLGLNRVAWDIYLLYPPGAQRTA